jgi:hypothetical protein
MALGGFVNSVGQTEGFFVGDSLGSDGSGDGHLVGLLIRGGFEGLKLGDISGDRVGAFRLGDLEGNDGIFVGFVEGEILGIPVVG